jgi:hypothetical protein
MDQFVCYTFLRYLPFLLSAKGFSESCKLESRKAKALSPPPFSHPKISSLVHLYFIWISYP